MDVTPSFDKIFILKRNKYMRGPYTMREIMAKGVRRYDKVWYEGLKDWTPVRELELFRALIRIREKETIISVVDKKLTKLKKRLLTMLR